MIADIVIHTGTWSWFPFGVGVLVGIILTVAFFAWLGSRGC